LAADVTLDFQIESPINKVWEALTVSKILAKWIWDNDFKPIVGYQFQFHAEPDEWWNGVVDGKVLEVDKPNKLSYTWASQGEITTITWTLMENSPFTHLHFEQSNFSEKSKAFPGALEGARNSWEEFGIKLKKLLENRNKNNESV